MSFKQIAEVFDFMQVTYAVAKKNFLNYAFIEVFYYDP